MEEVDVDLDEEGDGEGEGRERVGVAVGIFYCLMKYCMKRRSSWPVNVWLKLPVIRGFISKLRHEEFRRGGDEEEGFGSNEELFDGID